MKLAEALQIVASAKGPPIRVALACGFTPLHVQTFLAAEIAGRSRGSPTVEPGLFDDLLGTLGRIDPAGLAGVVVLLEWSDLDARLGVRGTHGWRPSRRVDLLEAVDRRLDALARAIDAIDLPLALVLPTLPLPPLFDPSIHRAAPQALALRSKVLAFAAGRTGARVVDPQSIDDAGGERIRLGSALGNGFPMTLEHACRVASLAAGALFPAPPLKGIVTDLDDTLWRGVLGEDGVDGIHWSLDTRSHGHALYQELLASLAEIGVLVGVVSKNDPQLVEEALARKDIVLPRDSIATIEAGWGLKSEAVRRTLQVWNVAPDAIVFVDDTPFERSEVQRQFPEMRVLGFPTNDDDALWSLLRELRALFGKSSVTAEDALRAKSVVSAAVFRNAAGAEESILSDAGAVIAISMDQPDARALELVNKTNQFNLNGRRIDDAAWQARTKDPDTFIASVTYSDKYSPLGKIALVVGRRGKEPTIDLWVMSCRAFSRRIEHRTLEVLFAQLGAERLRLAFEKTPRNAPFLDFLRTYSDSDTIDKKTFAERCPALYDRVEVHVRSA